MGVHITYTKKDIKLLIEKLEAYSQELYENRVDMSAAYHQYAHESNRVDMLLDILEKYLKEDKPGMVPHQYGIFHKFEEVPLFINSDDKIVKIVIRWRMEIKK